MVAAVKFLDGTDDTIEILCFPFGGPVGRKADGTGGKDLDGEYFSAKTDLCLDWFQDERPLLWHHGLDGDLGVTVIGRVDAKSMRQDGDGLWFKAQLDKRNKYHAQIKKLIEQDGVGGSSGAYGHLVRRAKSGHLDRWPWVEESLTPAPCNPYSRVTLAEATTHYKSLGLDLDVDKLTLLTDDDQAEATKSAATIPAEGQSEGSYEDLISDLMEQLNGRLLSGGVAGLPPVGYAYPVATFGTDGTHQSGYCVARFGAYDQGADADDAPCFYRIDFTIGDDGEPVLGTASPLSQVYVPFTATDDDMATKTLNMVPLALAADEAVRFATGVGRQAEAVAARRLADKRELSAPNRARLKALATALRSQADALDALTVPLPAEADVVAATNRERRLKLLRLELLEA